jgi:hypothetical protein
VILQDLFSTAELLEDVESDDKARNNQETAPCDFFQFNFWFFLLFVIFIFQRFDEFH